MVANDRTTSIGASDWAAALGEDPWKSPFKLWAEKTGKAAEDDLDDNEPVFWGKDLEPNIVRRFATVTGRKVEHNANADVTRHPDYPFLTATLDAIQTDKDRGIGALEAKNVGHWVGPRWQDDGPLWVQIQLQGQLACTGMPWGSMVGLIGGNHLEHYDADRNDSFIEAAIAKLAFFWTQVLDRIPPEPDGSMATAECLKRLYPGIEGEEILLPADAIKWDDQLIAAKESAKSAKALKQEAHNHLAAYMGDATLGRLPSGDLYTFTSQDRVGYTVKPTKFRVLRRVEK